MQRIIPTETTKQLYIARTGELVVPGRTRPYLLCIRTFTSKEKKASRIYWQLVQRAQP